jgi:hypothetical protein
MRERTSPFSYVSMAIAKASRKIDPVFLTENSLNLETMKPWWLQNLETQDLTLKTFIAAL